MNEKCLDNYNYSLTLESVQKNSGFEGAKKFGQEVLLRKLYDKISRGRLIPRWTDKIRDDLNKCIIIQEKKKIKITFIKYTSSL